MKKINLFLIFLIQFCVFTSANALYFDGYGNYSAMERNDDGSSSKIALGFDLNYYGNTFNDLYINNNGNVTFDNSLYTYTPFAFPSSEKIIAPFFADVDTRPSNGGNVYYDQRIVRGEKEFIATWEQVGYYSNNTDRLNTFQLAIQDDGDIGFSYGDMSWTIGDVSDVHAVAGFDAGDYENYLMLDGSRTSSIANKLDNKEFWFFQDELTGETQENRLEQVDVNTNPEYIALEERANDAYWGGLEIRSDSTNDFETAISYEDRNEEPFDSSKDTVIMIHGWDQDGDQLANWQEEMGDAFANRLGEENINILSWNWHDSAASWDGTHNNNDNDTIVPNEFVPGEAINVARELSQYLGDNYSGNVHIIGHSLGGGIATRSTLYLQDDYNISELTIFDSPTQWTSDVDLDQLLGGVSNNTYIQNYVTHFGAAYTGGFVNNISMLAGEHSSAQAWYTRTIQNETGSENAGFNMEKRERGTNRYVSNSDFDSDSLSENFNLRAGTPWNTNEQELVSGNNQIVLSQNDLSFYTTGEAWERDGVIYGQTNSPVFISSDLFIPVNAERLSFDLSILEWNEGDIFSLFWDDNLLISFETDFLNLDQWYDFNLIDISQWAGTFGTLTFGLFAQVDGVHSQFGVTNIEFSASSVPEPNMLVLFFSGAIFLYAFRRRTYISKVKH